MPFLTTLAVVEGECRPAGGPTSVWAGAGAGAGARARRCRASATARRRRRSCRRGCSSATPAGPRCRRTHLTTGLFDQCLTAGPPVVGARARVSLCCHLSPLAVWPTVTALDRANSARNDQGVSEAGSGRFSAQASENEGKRAKTRQRGRPLRHPCNTPESSGAFPPLPAPRGIACEQERAAQSPHRFCLTAGQFTGSKRVAAQYVLRVPRSVPDAFPVISPDF